MNSSSTTPSSSDTVLLLLDVTGIVRAANDAAGRLWKTTPEALAGQRAVSLFSFDITSSDPSWQESQWEVLVATSLNRPLTLKAQPFEPIAAVEVNIELQTAQGLEYIYFARVELVVAATPAPEVPASVTPAPVAPPAAEVSTETPPAPAPAPAAPAVAVEPDGPSVLAERGGLGFFDIDIVAGRVATSPAWKKMLGYAPDELADTHAAWRELIHPDDTAALPDQVGKAPASGSRDFSVEIRLRHRNGHYIWVQSSGVQLFGRNRTLQRVLGVNLDISERKETEDFVFACEDRLERLAESGPLAVFDFDFTTADQWFSPAWGELTGDSAENATLDTLQRVLPESVAEEGVVAFLCNAEPDQPFFTQALTLRTANGRTQPGLLGAHRQWSRKRDLQRVVGFVMPLPSGVGGGDGAIPSALVPGVLDILGEAVIIADSKARVFYLNHQAALLTGTTLEAARNRKVGDIFKLVRREDARPDDTAVDLVLAAEEQPRLHAEHALVPIGGDDPDPMPIVWTTRQIKPGGDAPSGIVVVFRDPESMTLTPEEIIRANRFESLGQLAGGIAHDFNNLLTTILGGISTAKDNRDYTKLIDAESACLASKTLTRQLLTFAKGSNSAAQQVLPTRDLLLDAVRIAAAGTTAVVSVKADDNVSPIQVDRGQILQVFQNLIINALQAMPEVSGGRVDLRATNVRLDENEVPDLGGGDYVQVEVEDNGEGIPPDALQKIFAPFFTTKKQGTGLGLATVLSIVRQHGGQITVRSTIGTGTVFTLYFPKATRPIDTIARSAPALRFGTGRILFLDDDPKICELTAGMLTSLEYTHDVVRTGEDAIACYRRYLNVGRPYDIVILDLNIVGGMGGEQVFLELKKLHPEVRAIVNSGYDSEEMEQRYLEMGFVGYISKPYRVGDLGRAIKAALGR